jgi:large repetitive protein
MSDPIFASAVTNPFQLTNTGLFISQTFVDIDGDGDLDVFVGNYDGNMLFFRNTGTNLAPAFAPVETNPFNFTDVGFVGAPTFVDINGDNKIDAFVGNRED